MEKMETVMVNRASNPALNVLGKGNASGHTAIPQVCSKIKFLASFDASGDI